MGLVDGANGSLSCALLEGITRSEVGFGFAGIRRSNQRRTGNNKCNHMINVEMFSVFRICDDPR